MSAGKIITGVPRSGKSTLAGDAAVHSDDFYAQGLTKSEQSEASKKALAQSPEVAEGVMMLYGMRRWLKENPRGKPAEEVVFLSEPKVPLSPGQQKMADQMKKAWQDIAPELRKRGVNVRTE